ncbi:hypothetical protein AAFF_G00018400 [Aldrovandia affinis]|uniref:Uncharacterized protein n=1 Tax=Aldrovandia affinis TaxID=143900 RepID=A0AAD7R2M8_9TELE|nr:hypothetical protein AAFF_G00018400 [Aldrovandia affinis]
MVERFLEQQPAITAALLSPELLQATQESLGDTQFVKDIKEAIHQDLKKRYAGDLEKTKLKIASALDARFKSLPFLSDDDRRETYRRVVDEAAAIAEQHPQEGVVRLEQEELSEDETAVEEEAPEGPPPAKRTCALADLLGDTFGDVREAPEKSFFDQAEEEIKKYIEAAPLPLSGNPLDWWKVLVCTRHKCVSRTCVLYCRGHRYCPEEQPHPRAC